MHFKLHRPFLRVALIAVWLVLSGSQTSFSQTPAPDQGPDYLTFLEMRSMLFQADLVDELISGEGVQWLNDFGLPEPDTLKDVASVWLLYYPGSVITSPGKSVIGTLADPQFWSANHDVGITLLHTNPTERAGGIRDRQFTPTIDGWFDRIGLDTAPELGTDADFSQLVANAAQQGAIVAGDLVPLHTGLGPDFRLAERGYKDYVGLYDMVEIHQEDWGLLPKVDDPWGTALVPREAAVLLKQKGYIPGLINSADAASGANEWSGWSATPELIGADGRPRRSVYLHVFKPSQPTLNWLDPTYAARRVQFGDAAQNILGRGVRVLRLDADTFLGLEPQPNSDNASTYLTPLAKVSATDTAFMIRKIGGWSYQEFAAPLAQLKEFAPNGPDLSYDFFTRAEGLAPLISGDALPLRLAHHFLLEAGVPAGTLIHDLQNHDEITFQLFELGSHDDFQFEGQTLNGKQLKEQILETMRERVAGEAAPYNLLYRPQQDGVATTFAGFIAPALGVQDPYNATPEQVALIKRGHLLVAHADAMIPGVFALSAWDLVGALPIPLDSIPSGLTAGQDFRWVNRGAVDLLNANPGATKSAVFGLPKAKALYGPLTDQLADPESFASRIKVMLAARQQYRIHQSEIIDVPNVGDPGVCVLVMRLPDSAGMAITALNYGRVDASVEVNLTGAQPMPTQAAGGSGSGSGSNAGGSAQPMPTQPAGGSGSVAPQISPTPPTGPSPAASCTTASPGADWVCVNGGWVPPDHPLAAGAPAPAATAASVASQPAPTSCTTVSPGADWVCVNGGWVPRDHPLAGGTPSPAATAASVAGQPAPAATGASVADPPAPAATAASLAGQPARDILTGQDAGTVSAEGRLTVRLEALSGRTIVIGPAAVIGPAVAVAVAGPTSRQ